MTWKLFRNGPTIKKHHHRKFGYRLGVRINSTASTAYSLPRWAAKARLMAAECLERQLSCNTPLLPPQRGHRRLEFSSAIRNQWQPVI